MFSSLKVGWTEGPAHCTLANANNSRMWINSHPACNKTYQGKKEGEAGLLGLRESPVVVLVSGGRSRWWGYGSRQGCWWSTVQLCSLLWCSLSLEKEKLVAVKLQEHAALLLPWNGVSLGVNESGAGWRWVAMMLCEKKGHGAGVGVRRRCWSWGLLLLLGVTGATREEEPSLHGWKGEEDCLGCLEGGDERFIGHGLLFVGAAIAEDFVVKEDEVAAEGKNGREMVWSWIGGDMDMISIKARGRKSGMVAVVTGKGMNGCCWRVRVFALHFWLKEEQFLCF